LQLGNLRCADCDWHLPVARFLATNACSFLACLCPSVWCVHSSGSTKILKVAKHSP
jgi:hypothetical protein